MGRRSPFLFFGSERLEELHELLANSLMSLVFVHVSAAVVLSKIEQVNLVSAMGIFQDPSRFLRKS